MVQASDKRLRADVSAKRATPAAAVPKRTLALVSLGCAKNVVDLQVRVGKLLEEGAFTLSPDPDRADVVIINTCSFIKSARDEAEAEIARALLLKKNGCYGSVVVAGCYPQRYPKAKAKFPGVDSWEGVPAKWEPQKTPGFRLTGKAFAYLKIAEGCNHCCAYCAIPSIRGRFRSRPVDDILAEAKALLNSGCRELNIVAQDPMLYGMDGRDATLFDLLWKLDALPGDFWVRVLYSYPSEISGEFVNWMLTSKHAVRYLDVPLQHTVPEVLKRMNRGGAVAASLAAAKTLREKIPGVTLRTTIMTGFPGETAGRFKRLMSDLAEMQFDHLGVFAYSPEEGTLAAKMTNRPSRAVAEARAEEVMEAAAAIWAQKAEGMLGSEQRALVVAPGVARLASQAPDVDGVTFIDESASPGEFVNLRLTAVDGFDFEGELV